MNINIGDVVSFSYGGGSNPGTTRLVKVNRLDSNSLAGTDLLDKNEYKTFKSNLIDHLQVVVKHEENKNNISTKFDKKNLMNELVIERKNGKKLAIGFSTTVCSVETTFKNKSDGVVCTLPVDENNFDQVFDILKDFVS